MAKRNSIKVYNNNIYSTVITFGLFAVMLTISVLFYTVILIFYDVIGGIIVGSICAVLSFIFFEVFLHLAWRPHCVEFRKTQILERAFFNRVLRIISYSDLKNVRIRTITTYRISSGKGWSNYIDAPSSEELQKHKNQYRVERKDCIILDMAGDVGNDVDTSDCSGSTIANRSYTWFFNSDNYIILDYSEKSEMAVRAFVNLPITDVRDREVQKIKKKRKTIRLILAVTMAICFATLFSGVILNYILPQTVLGNSLAIAGGIMGSCLLIAFEIYPSGVPQKKNSDKKSSTDNKSYESEITTGEVAKSQEKTLSDLDDPFSKRRKR